MWGARDDISLLARQARLEAAHLLAQLAVLRTPADAQRWGGWRGELKGGGMQRGARPIFLCTARHFLPTTSTPLPKAVHGFAHL